MDTAPFQSRLRQKNCRLTRQRLAVLEVIAREENRHSSATRIYEIVRAEHPGIGLATVYKTLHMLETEGMVDKIELLNQTAYYEISDYRPAHCHLICVRCGKITEIESRQVQRAIDLLRTESRFIFQKGNMLFYGICENCAQQLRRSIPSAASKCERRSGFSEQQPK